MSKAEYEEHGANICLKRFKANRYGLAEASGKFRDDEDQDDEMEVDVSGAESAAPPTKGMSAKEAKMAAASARARAAEVKAQAEKESRAARRQARGSKK